MKTYVLTTDNFMDFGMANVMALPGVMACSFMDGTSSYSKWRISCDEKYVSMLILKGFKVVEYEYY